MKNLEKPLLHKSVILITLAGAFFLVIGCKLFSAEYWIHRLDSEEEKLGTEPSGNEEVLESNSPMDYAQQFGVRCIDAPGVAPCPLEACLVAGDQFSAKYEITSELIGKANPDNFSCCAEYQFTNHSDTELMVFEHWISENDNAWSRHYYSENNTNQPLNCTNYYSQHDGKITHWSGLTEIIVIYANPHCEWVELDEPKLKNSIVPITGPCAP